MRVYMIVGLLLMAGLPARAGLVLTFDREINVPDMDIISGLAFDADEETLWIAGSGDDLQFNNAVIAWSVTNDQELSSFPIVAVPIADIIPTSIAVSPTTGNLFVFWSDPVGPPDEEHLVPRGAEFTPAGDMVRSLDSVDWFVSGATFDSHASLYGVHFNAFYSINQQTGARFDTVSVPGVLTGLGAAAIDPISGNLFAYQAGFAFPDGDLIYEIDLDSGTLLSTTEVDRSLLGGKDSSETGFAFSPSGDKVYIGGTHSSEIGETLVVLNRIIPEPSAALLALIGVGALLMGGRLPRATPD